MRVREKAWIGKSPNSDMYYVKTNSGAISYYSNYEDAMSHVNHVNNEDSKGNYFDDGRVSEEEEELLRQEKERKWQMQMAQAKRSAEIKDKEQKKVEENRKSKRSNEKFVYIISLIQRGKKYTTYFKGETNLLKMDSFTTYEAKDAKVFQTKASAQKVVDALTKNFLVKNLYRNLKVVQKKREIFAKS